MTTCPTDEEMGTCDRRVLTDGGTDGGAGADREEDRDEALEQARELHEEGTANIGFDSSDGWANDDDWDGGESVSRRGMITYTGGSLLGVLGLAGAGWFAFIREVNGPEEEVVIDYWDYIDRAQYYNAIALFHWNAAVEPPSAETIAVYSQASIDVEDTEVLDTYEEFDVVGVEELALVRAEISLDWGTSVETMNAAFAVAKNEADDWRMFDDGRNNDNEY